LNKSTAGQIVGKAAGSLGNAKTWLGSNETAKVGVAGEKQTAEILDALARKPGGPSVIHDLRIPIPGIKANIDHLVISGRTITIIDSKVWKPAFYWTIAGRTFRGSERFAPADKQTMPMARDAIDKHLAKLGIPATVKRPVLVIWPSNTRSSLVLWLLRSPAARAISGSSFALRASSVVGSRHANEKILVALAELAIATTTRKPATPTVTKFAAGEL
jgi:hypothetical protein